MSERLRVWHILEATLGGTGRHLELVVQRLPGRGVDITCVVSPVRNPAVVETLERIEPKPPPPSPSSPSEPDGADGPDGPENAARPAAAAPPPDAPPRATVKPLAMRREISPLEDLSAFVAIRRMLKAARPDLVHTHASKAGFLGRAAARTLGLPVVHTPHVMPMEWSTSLLYHKLERRAAGWTDRLIVLNDQQASLADEALGLPSGRVARMANGVDANEFYPASPTVFARARDRLGVREMRPIVGVAARLEPQKGMGTFLRAVPLVLKAYPRTLFLVAGDGSLRESLEARARELGVAESIRFLGAEERMPTFYHALDIFVLASLWEGMPYAILEAQASGLPVVATATPGAQALIRPGETGALSKLDDPDGLASAICTYLGDERLRERVGRRGRGAVLHDYTVDDWADNLAELYHAVVNERSAGRA